MHCFSLGGRFTRKRELEWAHLLLKSGTLNGRRHRTKSRLGSTRSSSTAATRTITKLRTCNATEREARQRIDCGSRKNNNNNKDKHTARNGNVKPFFFYLPLLALRVTPPLFAFPLSAPLSALLCLLLLLAYSPFVNTHTAHCVSFSRSNQLRSISLSHTLRFAVCMVTFFLPMYRSE